MAVNIKNRQYTEIFTNGTTDWLLANVGQWQKLSLDVEVSVEYLAKQSNPISIDYVNNTITLVNGATWGSLGFDNGMVAVLKYKYLVDTDDDGEFDVNYNYQQQMTIVSVYGSTMQVLETIIGQGFETMPVNYGTKQITDVKIYVDKAPEGCRIKYSHVTNENYKTKNLASFIDGSLTEFAFPDIGSGGTMEAIGIQSGMSIRDITMVNNGKKSGTDNVYQYNISIQFMISSFFEDVSTFEDMTPPSYLIGDGSLTDNFLVQFYPEWNNPNVVIENDLANTERLGNTGWFNENYNQLPNDFKIDSISYFDENGNNVDSLDFASKTKVKAIISGVPNLNSLTECGFGFAWVPIDDDSYKNKTTPFYRNCFVQSGSITDGFKLDQLYSGTNIGAGTNGASIDTTAVKFTSLNGKIVFEATFDPNPEFELEFTNKGEDDRNYIIWISVADGALTRNFSDRVSLLADFNQLTKNIAQVGAYEYIDNAFIEHSFESDALGVEKYEGLIQDGVLCRLPFRIKNDKSSIFKKITFGVDAFNLGTGETFDLERYEIDVSNSPIDSNGVQQISFNQSRGFKLVAGNNKNWVKIDRDSGLDTEDFFGYLAFFAFKIRWEDWIINQNAPSDFFDATKANDGLNNDWFDYLEKAGWKTNFFSEIISIEDDELVEYKNQWNFDFKDYDQNELISTSHKYFNNVTNASLNIGTDPDTGKPLGTILSNEETRIEITFDILDSGVWDLPNNYGIITIEIDKGAGQYDQRQLSSVWGSEDDNPLKPIEGETKLKMEVDGTGKEMTISCLVDPTLLQPSTRYRITGRVGCSNEDEPFVSGLYEFRYEETYE